MVREIIESKAFYANHAFIMIGERIIGVREEEKEFFIGDKVMVSADIKGFISAGINQEGPGTIIGINTDYSDYYYQILTYNGEQGSVKSARIEHADWL